MPITEQALPGASVPSGALVSPGGAQGVQGIQGPTAISADAGNIATLGSDNLVLVPQQTIWYQRLRSFNAIGNPNFEVAQRNVRNALVNPANGTLLEDRWVCGNVGSLNPNFGCIQTTLTPSSGVVVPGTGFVITTGFLRITIGTQKASLAAGDANFIQQLVEGPMFRELMSDVHSLQLLVRSSVANLKFGVALGDSAHSRSLTKLCSLGTANTITLIQLPNLPIWTSAGSFTAAPGSIGYTLSICTAAGSTFTSPANDTWQTGNFLGAVGQDNFMANTVGSIFEVFFVQHEPGSQSSTLMDLPFDANLSACERYYQKTYSYGTAIGAVQNAGFINTFCQAGQSPLIYMLFKRRMAKLPTLTAYSNITGASSTVRDVTAGADKTVTGNSGAGDGSFSGFTVTSPNASLWNTQFHYTADTGF